MLDTDVDIVEDFDYDVVRIIKDVQFAREKRPINELRAQTRVRFRHSEQQKSTLNKQLGFYGKDTGGLTMLLSRYPVKRFYRQAEKLK